MQRVVDQTLTELNNAESITEPVAIVHQGAFAYANAAFMRMVGVDNLSDLQALTFLDIVAPDKHEPARQLLSRKRGKIDPDAENAWHWIALQRHTGTPLNVFARAQQCQFQGEECVRIDLKRRNHFAALRKLAATPVLRYLGVALVVLFALLPILLDQHLSFDNSVEAYLSEDAPALLANRELFQNGANDQSMVLMFEGVALFSENFLTALHNLTRQIQRIKQVDKVSSVTNVDHIRAQDDSAEVVPLIGIQSLQTGDWASRESEAVSDRFAAPSLVAADGSALAVVITPRKALSATQRATLYEKILRAVDNAQLSRNLSASAGPWAATVTETNAVAQDYPLLFGAAVIIGLIMVWLNYRRPQALIIAAVVSGVTSGSIMAFYAFSGTPYTAVANLMPATLSALTLTALTLLLNALQAAAAQGHNGAVCVAQALKTIRLPAIWMSVLTIASLLGLAISPLGPMRDFGIATAVGALLIFGLVYGALPLILSRWSHAIWPTNKRSSKIMDSWSKTLLQSVTRNYLWIVIGALLLIAVSAWQIGKLSASSGQQHLLKPDHPIHAANARITEIMAGTNSLEVMLSSTTRDGFDSPENLGVVQYIQQWLDTQPEVDKTVSVVDFIEELNWAYHARDDVYRIVPDNPQMIEAYVEQYSGKDMVDLIAPDLSSVRIPMRINVQDTESVDRLMDRIRKQLTMVEARGISWELGGYARVSAEMHDQLLTGQLKVVLISTLLVFALLVAQWRSVRDAILSILPTTFALSLMFAGMALFNIALDVATGLAASVTAAFLLAASSYLLQAVRTAESRPHSNTASLITNRHATATTISQMLLAPCIVFATLQISAFTPLSHFGLVTAVGLFLGWIATLLLLPALLMIASGFEFKRLSEWRKRISA